MKRYYRGLTDEDIQEYKRTGRFPRSAVPVFLDNEVARYEGDAMPSGDPYRDGNFINVSDDEETARGYGSIVIWVDGQYVDATPSGKYGVVQQDYLRRAIRGRIWDFVDPADRGRIDREIVDDVRKRHARKVVEQCCSSEHEPTRAASEVHRASQRRS